MIPDGTRSVEPESASALKGNVWTPLNTSRAATLRDSCYASE